MKDKKIGFIGAGNMASALLKGLLDSGMAADQLFVSDADVHKAEQLAAGTDIHVLADNASLVERCDVILLCVKPQVMAEVVTQITARAQLFITIAAGIPGSVYSRWFGKEVALVRCMPNTPAMVQAGATGLFADSSVSAQQRQIAEQIMSAVGLAVWVDNEDLLDAVTAVSGSGPAYFFYMMQAIETAGQELGLSAELAHQLTVQTALGAARLAMASAESAETLRQNVTSPGGTTQAAIEQLQNQHGLELIKQAVHAASQRSAELARKMESAS